MENSNTKSRAALIAAIGMIIMVALSFTQFVPSMQLAGISVFVGLGFFFITEAVSKTPKELSAMRFKTFISDIKKRGVILWVLAPVVTAIIPIVIDQLFMNGEFCAHVIDRTSDKLSYDNALLTTAFVLVLAWGEEIAWRGFFLRSSMEKLPFWLCAVVSSALFAIGHFEVDKTLIVLYDLLFVFIDSVIFSIIFKKSGNCLVSTVSHIIGNAVGLIILLFIL